MEKKRIRIDDAVGMVLPHDLTKIIPGKFKGPAFKKGHVIEKKDIPELLKIGKEHIWLVELSKAEYHEDEAAEKFRQLAGKNISTTGPQEGKINFISEKDGILIVEKDMVNRINHIPDIVFATKHSLIPVKGGEDVAGIRIVPLATKKSNVQKVLSFSRNKKPLSVISFVKKAAGLVITGNEVAKGRIKDRFRPVLEGKLKKYGSYVNSVKYLVDDDNLIRDTILNMKKKCDLILVTGGMSVDPDDVTRTAIKKAGAHVVSYGAPVLPGNMFLMSYLGKVPLMGIPACGMFHKTTVLDLFLPLVLAGIKITREDILKRGYGGYCSHCRECRYPSCAFGKC